MAPPGRLQGGEVVAKMVGGEVVGDALRLGHLLQPGHSEEPREGPRSGGSLATRIVDNIMIIVSAIVFTTVH